ncbi:MAG: glycosyltransferase family A protein [Cyclonatronaceae bacterium]
MITANRMHFAGRAVNCFEQQSYPNKELIVIDDGKQDYSPLFERIDPADITYIRIPKTSDLVLGTLRNIALQYATGDYLVQWDDDDWYHPDRITKQAAYLDMGYDACCLSASLMHLDNPEYFFHPYIGYLPKGIPGSIMHRRSGSIRYPEYRRAEDTVYLKQWMKRRYIKLPEHFAGLFIRCFHGTNTWEEAHFTRRIRNSPSSWMHYLYHRFVRGEVTGHPRFRLPSHMQTAFDQYVRDSQNMNLFSTTSLQET